MMKVDLNRQKGNYAEHLVASWLSQVCFVRPVAEGTDIGIDLYCEAIVENQPFKHFWVQVKAVSEKNVKIENDKKNIWYDFKTKHLKYWAKQPIPVYAFLVPIDDWPPSEPDYIFGIRISEYIIKNGIPESETVRLKTHEGTSKQKIFEDFSSFVQKIVPWDSSAILLQKGIVSPIEGDIEFSPLNYPAGIGVNHKEKIIRNIYDSAIWIGLEIIESLEGEIAGLEGDLAFLENIANLYMGKQFHLLGLRFLFQKAMLDGNDAKAREYKKKALILLNEGSLSSDEDKKRVSSQIEDLFNEIVSSEE